MKNLKLILAIAFSPIFLIAQENIPTETTKPKESFEMKTLVGNRDRSHGGYFGLTTHYSRIQNKDVFSVGTRFGYLMNHVFTIGFTATGFVNDISFDNIIPGEKLYLQGGYGGLLLEPVVGARFPVHVTFPVLIGCGGMVYNKEGFYDDIGEENAYEDWEVVDTDIFFVVEPAVNLEINVASFFRLGVEAKYRYANGLQMINTSDKMLNGWSGGLSLKFGKF